MATSPHPRRRATLRFSTPVNGNEEPITQLQLTPAVTSFRAFAISRWY